MAKVNIYTDGSAKNIEGGKGIRGGYGIYFENGTVRLYSGGQYINTTSARMEMMAVLVALKKCEKGDTVNVYLDNQYVVYTFSKGWIMRWEKERWRNRLNVDLLKQLLIQYRRLNNRVFFHWVRGHDGNERNEICDILAKMGGRCETIIEDERL
jgi:ribonuclease HI